MDCPSGENTIIKEKFHRFLRDDPLFLRNVLLYKLLENNNIPSARSDFCEEFGSDAVDEKVLDYWFNLFAKGKVAENEKPFPYMYKAMWDRNRAIRTCILYESIQKDGFSSTDEDLMRATYNRFCSYMRDPVVDYNEFEFWFLRFRNGNLDMNVDWEKINEYAEDNEISIEESIKIHEEKNQELGPKVLMLREYLRDNPNALRTCLLYKFHDSSCYRAYSSFCEDVGKNFIDEETFDFWFYLFKQKRVSVSEESLPDISKVLTSEKKTILTCILYDSLRTTEHSRFISDPVFKKYKSSFSQSMIYREFDFWYYRFQNGEFDMDVEQSYDPNSPELSGLPDIVLEYIFDHLEYADRCALRKTSQKVCRIIDNMSIKVDYLKIRFSEGVTTISYGEKHIPFIQNGNDCWFSHHNAKSKMKGENHLELALKDLVLLLKNPKLKINRMYVEFSDIEDQDEHLEKISDAFKSINHQIHVESYSISSIFIDKSMSVLPFLKPGILKEIRIDSPTDSFPEECSDGISEVMGTEQWEKASRFETSSAGLGITVGSCFHFKSFKILDSNFGVADMRSIKEDLLTSPLFKSCSVIFNQNEDDEGVGMSNGELAQFRRVLGKQAVRKDSNEYHLPIPNSDEHFEIDLSEDSIQIHRAKNENV